MNLKKVHHIALICSDYEQSKAFYTQILGLEIIRENYRKDRDSWKLDLALNGEFILELFSFLNPPKRVSFPEACGLRHLAFQVDDLETCINELKAQHILVEPIRTDELTQKRFCFFSDPDGLPIEFYEV